MKVIFLDVDGVLNNSTTEEKSPEGFVGLDATLVDRLSKIAKIAGADVVLTSTWKTGWSRNFDMMSVDAEYLDVTLSRAGVEIIDKTEDIDTRGSYYRGQGILKYLEEHPEVDKFIILDDNEFDFLGIRNLKPIFIQTDPVVGLTETQVNLAIELLGRIIDDLA